MISFNECIKGEKTVEEVLNKHGYTAGMMGKFADQGFKDARFMSYMGYISEEEAQSIANRIVAKIGTYIREVE